MKAPLAAAAAVVLCPCHVPLYAGLLAGTSAGAFAANELFLGSALGFGFLGSAVLAIRWSGQADAKECDDCDR